MFTAGALLVVLLASAMAWWWSHPPDPEAALRAHHAPLASVKREPLEGGVPGLEQWTLVDERGRSFHALWRPASDDAPGTWTVVLLGGLRTGVRTAHLVPDSLPVHVLAVDWPWDGPRSMSRLMFLRQSPRIRASLLRSPAALALGVEAVRRVRADGRVALMGVSLGVPPAAAALRLVQADAVLLADGGADLATQFERDVRHTLPWPLSAPPLSGALGSLGARLLEPLDPMRHEDAAAGTPVLLVEAAADSRIPRACRDRLRATFPHATVRVHHRDHVRGGRREAIAAIAGDAREWLDDLSAAEYGGR